MPKGLFAIGQREITITRSVARDVVKNLIEELPFPKNAELIFSETQGAQKLIDGKFVPCEPKIKTDNRNYVFIESTETFIEPGINRDTHLRNQHLHLFQDREIGMYIVPYYATMKVEMNLRFRSRDLTAMTEFRNALKLLSTDRKLVFKHDVFYDYNIPDKLLYLITLAHTLKEKVAGSGIPLKDYIKMHFKEGVTTRSNLNDSYSQVICQECQREITGFTNDAQPFNVIEINEGIYELNLPHEVHYRQPYGLHVKMPCFIHNQFIGMNNVKMIEPVDKNVSSDTPNWTPTDFLSFGNRDMSRYSRPDGGKRLLPFDDWYPEDPTSGTHTLLITPITVDVNDPNAVANLNEIDDSVLPEGLKTYLKENYKNTINKHYRSIIHIEVFETYGFERMLDFTMDENLVIRTLAELDPRYRVHLRISIINDWSLISNEDMSNILAKPDMCIMLAKIIDSGVKHFKADKTRTFTMKDHLVERRGAITVQSMRDWLVSLPSVNTAFKRAPSGFMNTVLMGKLSVGNK